MTQANSEAQTAPAETDQPTSVAVVLECAELPCGDCGIVVTTPDPATVEKAERVRNGRATTVLVSRCPACIERDRTSTSLAERYLRGGVIRDGRRYTGKDAITLLIDTRVAVDAAGMRPSSIVAFLRPGAGLSIEIEHLGLAIRGLRWRDRLSAPTSLVADPIRLVEPGTANPYPWAHLDEEDRARLRRAVAKVLSERSALQAPDVALVPPPVPDEGRGHRGIVVEAGCLYCGVGTVTMTALNVARCGGADAAARSTWSQHQVNPARLGARQGGPTRLLGWLCPDCEDAALAEGSANSAGALEGALATFLGVSRRTIAGEELWVAGLHGWAALVAAALRRDRPRPAPNAEPWGHLSKSELDDLALGWRLGGA